MNIYEIKQSSNTDYDTYDSAVVIAPSAYIAKRIHPGGGKLRKSLGHDSWVSDPTQVKATLIGKAKEGLTEGVILGSYNAG